MSNPLAGVALRSPIFSSSLAFGQDCLLCAGDSANEMVCVRCVASLPLLAPDVHRVVAPFEYRFPVDRLVQRFKFAGDLAVGRWGDALSTDERGTVQRWVDIALALRQPGAAVAAQAGAARTALAGLSARELEVLQRIAVGDSNKVIARTFDLSPHTVKRHVANILDKLALASRGQAAAWYRDHALASR